MTALSTSAPGELMPGLHEATRDINAWAEVDLDALDANVGVLRRALGRRTEIIAVVKANAYGAGMDGVAPALEAAGIERFAVVWASEGLALRRLGITRPILVLGHSFPADAPSAVDAGITLACHSLELGRALSAAAMERGTTAAVHIAVDSGLHREGVSPDEAVALALALRTLPALTVEGLSTHMANADEADDSYTETQHGRFQAALASLDWIPYWHTANSATALRRPALRHHGVRLGLSLHGILPENTPDPGIQPILAIKARLARVSTVEAGEGVSYGLTWRAARPSRVALVPVGYADGWRRALGNSSDVLIAGRRCPVVGRVMMDQFVADITDLPATVAEGDECVLLGTQGEQCITADEVARAAGTIPWDVLASLQARLPRFFHRSGAVVRPFPFV